MRWTKEEIDKVFLLMESGKNFREIGELVNRTHYSVSSKMNKLGYKGTEINYSVPNKNETKYSNYDWVEIQIKYDSGMSYEDLINDLNLSTRAIIWAKKNKKLIFRSRSEGLKLAWKNGKFKKSSVIGLKRYRQLCEFKFSLNDYPDKFDFGLIEEYGWYKAKNRGDNSNGVSRDHMYSVSEGFENNIDPYYISHPANCRLMRQNENSSKKNKCSITLEELKNRVNNWDKV
jgi:hypothetical protein